MKNTKFILIALFAVLFSVMLTGCGSGGSSNDNPATENPRPAIVAFLNTLSDTKFPQVK